MKVTYEFEVDVLRVLFGSGPVEENDENKPGVIIDYDIAGNIAGLEILNASHRVETSPQQSKQSYFLEQRKRTK